MSIQVMSRVWLDSDQSGSDLLLLLALADNANDDGVCWPSIKHLAQKIRMCERSVINIIKRLEESGELYVAHRRNSGNRYLVATSMSVAQVVSGLKGLGFTESEVQKRISANFSYETYCSYISATSLQLDKCNQVAYEPSLNHHVEPSCSADEKSPAGETDQTAEKRSAGETDQAADIEEELFGDATPPPRETLPPGMSPTEWVQGRTVRATQRWAENQGAKPWTNWHPTAVSRGRNGVSAESLQRVGWLIENKTGLVPTDSEWSGWLKACVSIYQAAEGDFDVIAEGVDETWKRRDKQYRPHHANGFVGEVRKANADRKQAEENAVVAMVYDPETKKVMPDPQGRSPKEIFEQEQAEQLARQKRLARMVAERGDA